MLEPEALLNLLFSLNCSAAFGLPACGISLNEEQYPSFPFAVSVDENSAQGNPAHDSDFDL